MFAVFAAIAVLGIVTVTGWITCVSLGIRREDRNARGRALPRTENPPGRISRLARHSTGLHRA